MPPVPQRIVSLVPSLTELLIDLGLQEFIVGRTRFCVHPKEEVGDIPIIGGTKNPRLDKIKQLNPDYILANKEENRKDDILELDETHNVRLTDISTIEDALITIHELGKELGVTEKADQMVSRLTEMLADRPEEPPLRAAYFIWRDPLTVGRDTYIHDVMKHWNLTNIFGDQLRYPKITLHELADRDPELILLSSEPFPFKEKHVAEVEKALPDVRVLLVEGEWFSWYGSHMLHSFNRLNVWRKAIS